MARRRGTDKSRVLEYKGELIEGYAIASANSMLTGDGFVTGEGATYAVTGTQTDAGSSANAFTYTLAQPRLLGIMSPQVTPRANGFLATNHPLHM